ncbi:MAG TPA: hypothetical protein VM100_08070 [Longimicrobiales bacterium]|nr:hypothetical protein [Longimicrobiales bacterium]
MAVMEKTSEPWLQYYQQFTRRLERIPQDAFDRRTLLYEAAHDAYEHTTNDLTDAGWNSDRALVIARMFGSVVKEWVDGGGEDVQDLREELKSQYENWAG